MFNQSALKLLAAVVISFALSAPAAAQTTVGGLASAPDPLAAIEARQQALFEKIAPSVIYISQGNSLGSGFFVSDDGLALTNAHVVGKAKEVDVVLRDGRHAKAKVLELAGDNIDLALIQVPLKSTVPLPLAGFSNLRIGSWVASVGHSAGGIWTYSTGMVSNIYPSEMDEPVFQTQIPINPGASGGPVFNRHGQVVGVVTSGMSSANSINFAIRSDTAVRMFEKLSAHCDCLTITAPAGIPVFVNNQMVGKGPRIVLPVEAGTFEIFAVIQGKMNKKKITFPATRSIALE